MCFLDIKMNKDKQMKIDKSNPTRAFIINTLHDEFKGKINDEQIENALIKAGVISAISKSWLKEYFINRELSARECALIAQCSLGHIQGCIRKYKLEKKRFGITTGNNQAFRRMVWRRNLAKAQPNREEVIVFSVDSDKPLFEASSIMEASRRFNIPREHIRDCLNQNKPRKTAFNFRFEYKKDYYDKKEKEKVSTAIYSLEDAKKAFEVE